MEYKYTGNASFEDAYHDCKLVADSIVDDESFQKADTGLLLYYMDRILEALHKQTSINLVKYFDDDVKTNWCCCPTCRKSLGWEHTIKSKHCPECGQKLR